MNTKLNDSTRKPTSADYEKRLLLETSRAQTDEYLDFMNSIDWSPGLIEENGKYGLINALGEVVVQPLYEDVKYYSFIEYTDIKNVSVKHDGKWGVWNGTTNEWIIDPEYEFVGHAGDLVPVYKEGKWGVINLQNRSFLIPLDCDSISHDHGLLFINGLAIYQKNGKTGVISSSHRFSDAIFDDVEWWDGLVKVRYEGVWGYLDEEAKFTTDEDCAYFSADCF